MRDHRTWGTLTDLAVRLSLHQSRVEHVCNRLPEAQAAPETVGEPGLLAILVQPARSGG